MQTDQIIEIKSSKIKTFFLLIGSIGLVALGIWLVTSPPSTGYYNTYMRDPEKVKMSGYICIILFGFGIFKFSKQFFDNSVIFILDNSGMTNNMKNAAAKYIPWTDMKRAEIVSTRRQSFILIKLKNPEEYINNQSSFLRKKNMQLDYKLFGTPITLHNTTLKISLNKFLNIINDKIKAAQ